MVTSIYKGFLKRNSRAREGGKLEPVKILRAGFARSAGAGVSCCHSWLGRFCIGFMFSVSNLVQEERSGV